MRRRLGEGPVPNLIREALEVFIVWGTRKMSKQKSRKGFNESWGPFFMPSLTTGVQMGDSFIFLSV